jgi:hypothetical protein
MPQIGKRPNGSWGVLFFVALLLIVLTNTNIFHVDDWLIWIYPVNAVLMIVALLAIGAKLHGRPAGLIIDNRNRVSLSKLQMLLWTIVVVSALVAAAAYNVRNGIVGVGPSKIPLGPLEIVIPSELLFAMGIAATSFIATPTVLSLKAKETPTQANVDAAAANAPGMDLLHSGKVFGRADLNDAKWSDIFMGDEVGNAATPDLSKIQQFAITLLLVGIYSAQLVRLFGQVHVPGGASFTFFNSLPVLGDRFVVLMGISHASYLVYKAAPHTSSADPTTANQASTGQAADQAAG